MKIIESAKRNASTNIIKPAKRKGAMQLIELEQGSQEWHAHRATHFNASETAAMLGISPYKTRDQLLREKKTGLVPEIDAATQKRFDDGHRFEALARPFAEQVIGKELFPCVGILVGTKLSASFDGITMDESIVWECKTMNASLRECSNLGLNAHELPEHYRVQMEQQLLVSRAEQVLFSAVSFHEDGSAHEESRWRYQSDPALRQRILDGWSQFEKDLADYLPEPLPVPKPTARAPETLPALHVQVQGNVVASNIGEFKRLALTTLDTINTDLQTDQDFADAQTAVKWCKALEKKLVAAEDNVLAQTADIDAIVKTLKDIGAHARNIRLNMEKTIKAEKENRKLELVRAADEAIFAHARELEKKLTNDAAMGFYLNLSQRAGERTARLASAIKGLHSLDSIQSALNTVVAECKIEAQIEIRRMQENVTIAQSVRGHKHLLPDLKHLIQTKHPDDFKATITVRIAEHEQAMAAKREQKAARRERERIEDEIADESGKAGGRDAEEIAQRQPEQQAGNHTDPLHDMTAALGEWLYYANDARYRVWAVLEWLKLAALKDDTLAPVYEQGQRADDELGRFVGDLQNASRLCLGRIPEPTLEEPARLAA